MKLPQSFLFVSVLAWTMPMGCRQSSAPSGGALCEARIARHWHGKTPNAKADEYAAYLADAIKKFRAIQGNVGYQMMRETVGDETHFAVISYWESREAIKGYAGEDIRRTRPAPRDRDFLVDPEDAVMNYDIVGTEFGCQ